MHPIDAVFDRLRRDRRMAFVAFLPAGDPSLDALPDLLAAIASAGAQVIEVGFPFSDPIADGPVIQAAFTRALERGVRLDDVFATVRRAVQRPELATVPLLAMVSYSLVFRRGSDHFLDQAQQAGFQGLIVPDLPLEEAEPLRESAAQRDLKLVLLVTPTTSPERASQIVQQSGGFVYCVSVAGITGERTQLPAALLEQLHTLRQAGPTPLCVGFGVSRPEHVSMLRGHCDGVIVGSALVRRLEAAGPNLAAQTHAVSQLVRELTAE